MKAIKEALRKCLGESATEKEVEQAAYNLVGFFELLLEIEREQKYNKEALKQLKIKG